MVTTSIDWHVTNFCFPGAADGIITCDVWLTLGGVDYPVERWSDFAISVVSSAVTAYTEIADGENEAWSYFFDGSYYLYYRRTEADEPTVYIEANCDRDEDNPVSIAVGEVRLEQLRTALAHVVQEILTAVRGKPYTEKDVEIMDRKMADLNA
ncbi:hypothetical protein EV385_4330 [Krasilnikovia cinnamomea]|uniref:Uncharacterized protein n=1 Tax=Krasilnikovia cinnamomea TaxID=349313 RepID=A0A4Q7ZPW3_9ACTN|nr:hypothetical protein [Krasilnikovia cinnamomea]RZU52465.1 hypothetical protein EV385_4330 [Krasilnikovia cinnamomea]